MLVRLGEAMLITTRDGAVLRVALNRPEKLNALSRELVAQLAAAAENIRADRSIRAVLLTATGRAFCTGADLTDTALLSEKFTSLGEEVAERMRGLMNPLMQSWYRLPVPVVAAVNGIAAGAGVSLALVADIVIAAASATFSLPFVPRLGLVPDLGATYGLPQRLSTARLRGLALLGTPIGARTAVEWGLIWEAVEDASLDSHAMALAQRLASGPTEAIAGLKSLLADGGATSLEAQLEREAVVQRVLADSEDFREGLDAFRHKRAPAFRRK
jgi:2-(1,2-epoxy-1,2-dihydrophenyl)acetyl-CoA isomerase